MERFHRAIKMVSLENFLESLEEKEDSRLGNNGILVSGGQKQRISIARELYKDVELLIMDEATLTPKQKKQSKIILMCFMENLRLSLSLTDFLPSKM